MTDGRSRWEEIREIQAKSGIGYRILFGLVLVSVLVLLGKGNPSTRNDFDLNLLTEIIGVAITVLIVDTIYSFRDKKRREQELQERLIREVRSPDHGIAIDAIHQLRDKGWLCGENGLLQGEHLPSVNWANCILNQANLACAVMPHASLEGAQLDETFLKGATLWHSKLDGIHCSVGANFRNTKMRGSTFVGAWLHFVNFSNADLQETDFIRANLFRTKLICSDLRAARIKFSHINDVSFFGADLYGAEIEGNIFHGRITLPDGEIMRKESDFEKFTKFSQ